MGSLHCCNLKFGKCSMFNYSKADIKMRSIRFLFLFSFFVHSQFAKGQTENVKTKITNEMTEYRRCHNINDNNSYNNRDKPRWIVGWMTIHKIETHQYRKGWTEMRWCAPIKHSPNEKQKEERNHLKEILTYYLLMKTHLFIDGSVPIDHHHHLYNWMVHV